MVNSYYSDINKYQLLSPKEEKILATRALLGDNSAAEELITGNLRFVVSVAKQYVGQGVPIEDLINEGNVGLITAVKKFDPTRGYKFITYASYWIRQAILKALGEQNRTIRIPTNKIALLSKVRRAQNQLEVELERYPSYSELEDFIGDTISLNLLQEIDGRTVDIDEEIDDSTVSRLNLIPNMSSPSPDGALNESLFLEELNFLSSNFDEREKDILYLYYGIGTGVNMTLEQIGNIHGICRERVRQIKKVAIRKLQNHPQIGRLREFL